MSEPESAPAAPPAAETPAKKKRQQPKKAGAAKKSGSKSSGPSVSELLLKAVSACKERSGASLPALKKALSAANYDVDKNNSRVKLALKALVTKGSLVQVKGTGASGSFKINKQQLNQADKKKAAKKKSPAKKPASAAKSPKKPKKAPSAAKSPKKAPAKKPAAAKKPKAAAAKPKKAAKSPAKKAAKPKSPAKKAAKPKVAKSPAKKLRPRKSNCSRSSLPPANTKALFRATNSSPKSCNRSPACPTLVAAGSVLTRSVINGGHPVGQMFPMTPG
ncbi:uncharacterized protein PAF06_001248 [Gastrophryne carolinensis]